jgi:hypothetical protein
MNNMTTAETEASNESASEEWEALNRQTNATGAARPKLVRPEPTGDSALDTKLTQAWADHVIDGFAQNKTMFQQVLDGFMRPYHTTVLFYKVMFGVGIGLFAVAALLSLITREPLFGLIFGGLGMGVFLTYFISQPLRALEQNLQFIAWLGVSYNNYWTRLMHVSNSATALDDIKKAGDDFNAGMQQLIEKHAELSGKRPGSNV